MADKDYKAFIVEGEAREPLIIGNISKVFFGQGNFKIITLPAGQNIYMLWKRLKADDFDTDIIEVLREEHEELEKQLEGLNRGDFSEVYLFLIMMGIKIIWADYDFTVWKNLIEVFSMRISCIMNQEITIAYEQYTKMINPFEIYKMEEYEIHKQRVFILSAFPEFLVDYFGIRLWRTCVKHTTNLLDQEDCHKNLSVFP